MRRSENNIKKDLMCCKDMFWVYLVQVGFRVRAAVEMGMNYLSVTG